MEWAPAIVVTAFFGYALVSHRLERTVLTGPIVFAALGLVIGPEALDLFDLATRDGSANGVLTITLVIVLFTDASAINSSRWREDGAVAGRLLGIGLPLSIVFGWLLAFVVLTDLEIWEAAVLSSMLAPTDAALGKAVVSNPRVPKRIRQALSVESGLNDGIVLPVFVAFLEVARAAEESPTASEIIVELVSEVGIAVIVGVGLGWVGAIVIRWAGDAQWATQYWLEIGVIALALLAYVTADPVGGSGFIAAWVAGMVFGRVRSTAESNLRQFAETTGDTLTMLSFLLFGLVLGPVLVNITWQPALYGVLSLTVVRIAAVALSMTGSGLTWRSVLYLGWFGPRGLATLILTITVVDSSDLAGANTIRDVAILAVAMSVLAHGVTALMGSNAYADWIQAQPAAGDLTEDQSTPDLRMPRRARVSPATTPRSKISSTESDGPSGLPDSERT
jgi:NhaP-type Na+/H+ or K+/H+ antiporter